MWFWPLTNWEDCATLEDWGAIRGTALCATLGSAFAGACWVVAISCARRAAGRPWLHPRNWIVVPAIFLVAAIAGGIAAEVQRPSWDVSGPRSGCDVYE